MGSDLGQVRLTMAVNPSPIAAAENEYNIEVISDSKLRQCSARAIDNLISPKPRPPLDITRRATRRNATTNEYDQLRFPWRRKMNAKTTTE
jgi:hypothetical protein